MSVSRKVLGLAALAVSSLAAGPVAAAGAQDWDGFYAGFSLGVGSTPATSGTPGTSGASGCNVGGTSYGLAPTDTYAEPGSFVLNTGSFTGFPTDSPEVGLTNVGYYAPSELGLVATGPTVGATYTYSTGAAVLTSTTLALQPLAYGPGGIIGLSLASDPTRCVILTPDPTLTSIGTATFVAPLPPGTVGINFPGGPSVIYADTVEGIVEVGAASPGSPGSAGGIVPVGALHVGYNRVLGEHFVVGVEGEVLGSSNMLVGSVQGRAGVAIGDAFLLYMSGGLAVGSNATSGASFGLVGGLGTEYAITDALSARIGTKVYGLALGSTAQSVTTVTSIGLSFAL